MMKLKQDVKERWIAALESGEYPQTYGKLHRLANDHVDPVGFCCLGVLAAVEGVEETQLTDWSTFQFPEGEASANMPDPHWFASLFEDVSGMDVTRPTGECDYVAGPSGLQTYMAERLNDSRQYSFQDIAQFIRNNL